MESNVSLQLIEQKALAERANDLARVAAGQVSAAQLGAENGAFGRAVAQAGSVDWCGALRAV